ncbi:hypothetical protein O9992_20025 [Vibrio lentus]|nr:hypothetical protein [Vibrio lentus]
MCLEEAVSEISDLLKAEVIRCLNPLSKVSTLELVSLPFLYPDDERLWPERCRGYEFFLEVKRDCFDAFESAVGKQRVGGSATVETSIFALSLRYVRELKEPKGLLGIVDRAVLL